MRRLHRGTILLFVLLMSVAMLFACSNEKPVLEDGQEPAVTEIPDDQDADLPSNDMAGTDDADSSEGQEPDAQEPEGQGPKVQEGDTKEASGQEDTSGQDVTSPQEATADMRDIPSVDLVKEIKIGWNLGNTMDATGDSGIASETSWGNPFTTKEMIDTVKEAGFNTVRIPTTWEKHLGAAPEYKIDEAWLDRVQDIVDDAMENEMYVILNMHHEEWHFPSYENYESAKAILTSVWAQIADRFAGYNEHLIFEGMNEPRMKGTNFEWNGGNDEGRDVVNQLNAAFVETIRNSGGNNQLRHLMIPPYAASSDTRTWNAFIIPDDDKIIVSIHAYTPYNFALNKNGTVVWSMDNTNDTREIDNLMNNIYNNFVSKGYPVIIGEFGAMDKNNLDSRTAWSEYYIKKAAEKGIPCIWWDNGAFTGGGELFGLLNRTTKTWQHPDVVEALMKGLNQ